jgi:hypothetical protein
MKYDSDIIDSIRCYQSVMFNKRNETFFASRRINERQALEIEVLDKINMVSIKNEQDHILVPLTNVSAIYLKSPIKIEQDRKAEIERNKVTAHGRPKKIR